MAHSEFNNFCAKTIKNSNDFHAVENVSENTRFAASITDLWVRYAYWRNISTNNSDMPYAGSIRAKLALDKSRWRLGVQ